MPHGRLSVFLVAATLGACSAGPKDPGRVSISAGAVNPPASTGPAAPPPAAPTALPAGVVVTSLDVAVRELELDDGECLSKASGGSGSSSGGGASGASGTSGASDSGQHPRECSAELGPFVAHLDAAALAAVGAGKVPPVWTATVPAGTYSELEAKLCSVDPASMHDEAQAALATAMAGASVVLRGTYQAPGAEGAPVEFAIPVSACAELERHVKVTVDETGAISNLTLRLDVGSWFLDSSGNALAPDTAAGVAAIAARIAASLDLYDDEDRDGCRDD